MGQDLAFFEQQIAEQRHELDVTVAAIAYQADLRHRLPEYAESVAKSTASAARSGATTFGKAVAERGLLLASYVARVMLNCVLLFIRTARRTAWPD